MIRVITHLLSGGLMYRLTSILVILIPLLGNDVRCFVYPLPFPALVLEISSLVLRVEHYMNVGKQKEM